MPAQLYDPEIAAAMIEQAKGGKSQREIGEDWGVSQNTVSAWMRRCGYSRGRGHNGKSPSQPTIPVDEMILLHKGGKSLSAIANVAGLPNYQRVSELLKKAGYDPGARRATVGAGRKAAGGGPAYKTGPRDRYEKAGPPRKPGYEPLTEEEKHWFRHGPGTTIFCEWCERQVQPGTWVQWVDHVGPVHAFGCPDPTRPRQRLYPEVYDGGLEAVEARVDAELMLRCLSRREREVVLRRYADETLETIAKEWGVTRQRIRQIEKQAMEKLTALFNPGPEEESPEPEPGIDEAWPEVGEEARESIEGRRMYARLLRAALAA